MSHINISYDKIYYTTETIGINCFDLSVGGKELFKDSKLTMSPGSKYGLIGRNGSGKSSLLKKLIELKTDPNSKSMKINTLYVEQEIDLDERLPIDYVMDSNSKLKLVQKELERLTKELENEELDPDESLAYSKKCLDLEEILNLWNPDMERIKVYKILHGLGFTEQDLEKESKLFSGGWQMRLSLARALYLEPDLLLLDEPTNHLDLEAIIWLGNYLNEWKHTVIIVSHNIGFLNDVCDYILNIENKKLVQYKGNYSMFKKAKEAKQKEHEKEYEKYDKKLKELKKKGIEKSKINEFISKNEVKKPDRGHEVGIRFSEPYKMKSNAITLSNVSFSYVPDVPILSNVSISLDMDMKMVLVGPNGSGKSTLIKLMTGELKPTSGEVRINPQFRIGYYNQHFENFLPLDSTPIKYLNSIIPKELIKEGVPLEQMVRNYLGQVHLEASAHNKLISELSGGQKARVAIIRLIFGLPNCLILDEPTNHLDIETVESLITGLVNFQGGIIVITHEPELIDKFDGLVWMMDPELKGINRGIDTYEKYSEYILDNY
jgi:ATP-binding cassette subfamily F protein 1